MEIVIRNNQRLIRINQARARKVIRTSLNLLLTGKGRNALPVASHALPFVEVSLLFVNDRKMRELNLAYRGIDKTTDVLSFPLLSDKPEAGSAKSSPPVPAPHVLLGDIVINPYKAKIQAKENKVSLQREMSWLLIHGLLHLLGFDHEKNRYQAKKMRDIENELMGIICR